jgi:hydroquinone glucosyltransferase
LQFLPSGFLERTKEKRFVITSWAPQIQILSHNSIGGFLTHCGWNSTLESVVHGVPLITWPLFAEQKMNAVLLSEGLKVGLRPRFNENGIVERLEVAKVIKCLMEGEEGEKLRNNMKDLREAASNAIKEDGSSTKTISQLALKWRNSVEENLKFLIVLLSVLLLFLFSSVTVSLQCIHINESNHSHFIADDNHFP